MLKGKFRPGKIPTHLKSYVKGGTIYSILDQSEIIFIRTEGVLIPFRQDQFERPGEFKPEALIDLRSEDDFVSALLDNFEMDEGFKF
jgi:hypothetical protein